MNAKVLRDLQQERDRQDAKWGGPAHDDRNSGFVWGNIIYDQIHTAMPVRERMVRIAATAIAAIESFDRASKTTPAAAGTSDATEAGQ